MHAQLPNSTAHDFIQAAKIGNEEKCRVLLEKGCDVNFFDDSGRTALYWASILPSPVILCLLLRNGANVDAADKRHQRALHKAVMRGMKDCVQCLVEAGATLDAMDSFGRTPLHWACANRHDDIARVLIDAGSNARILDMSGQSPADLAMHSADMVEYIKQHCEDRTPRTGRLAPQDTKMKRKSPLSPSSTTPLLSPRLSPAQQKKLFTSQRDRQRLWESVIQKAPSAGASLSPPNHHHHPPSRLSSLTATSQR